MRDCIVAVVILLCVIGTVVFSAVGNGRICDRLDACFGAMPEEYIKEDRGRLSALCAFLLAEWREDERRLALTVCGNLLKEIDDTVLAIGSAADGDDEAEYLRCRRRLEVLLRDLRRREYFSFAAKT